MTVTHPLHRLLMLLVCCLALLDGGDAARARGLSKGASLSSNLDRGYYIRSTDERYGKKTRKLGVAGMLSEVWKDTSYASPLESDCIKQLRKSDSSDDSSSSSSKSSKGSSSDDSDDSDSSDSDDSDSSDSDDSDDSDSSDSDDSDDSDSSDSDDSDDSDSSDSDDSGSSDSGSSDSSSSKSSKSGSSSSSSSDSDDRNSRKKLCEESETALESMSAVEFDSCAAVALETLVTGEASKTYRVTFGLVVEESAAGSIDADLRNALQRELAPALTDCASAGRRRRGRRRLAGSATNVVFGRLQVTSIRECTDVSAQNADVTCLEVSGPVTVYGDSTNMEDALARAPYEYGSFGIAGLEGITEVDVFPSNDLPVAEGQGAGTAVASSKSPHGNVMPGDGMSAGAIVGIVIVLLGIALVVVFIVVRRRRQAEYWDKGDYDTDASASHDDTSSCPSLERFEQDCSLQESEPEPRITVHTADDSLFGEVQYQQQPRNNSRRHGSSKTSSSARRSTNEPPTWRVYVDANRQITRVEDYDAHSWRSSGSSRMGRSYNDRY